MKRSPAYKQGYQAHAHGKKVGDNPYGEHEDAHWDWMEGFLAAAEEDVHA